MTPADRYRRRAAEFSAMARIEKSSRLQLEYAKMAQSYLHLAQLADKNGQNDLVYETPVGNPEQRSI
jgi:hypothetical protein